jgi:hypothetical protein
MEWVSLNDSFIVIIRIIEWLKGDLRMLQAMVLNLFLYFPEDKREYIPAAITMAIFFVLAILTFRFIIRVSKKQEQKTKEFEERVAKEIEGKH